ncbi:COPI associated protein [Seminavis robusta]|uniref:COPI associated protein n=1 Tax=Seminavis robusta TaxID=568900 RepID=A0A9N8EBZ9_9STRA|nr:COPI associated protein [Seminavis robusta]|eukprot:Sro861_g212320.1 COPI associated protein (216) ;mRNA; f:34764-35603
MADTPAWLSSGNDNNAAAAGGGDNFEMTTGVAASQQPTTPTVGSTTSATAASSTEAAEEDLPRMILTMRLANMGVAIALIVCSVFVMVGIPGPSVFVLAIYATCGGLLICCLETQLKFLRVIIAVNFGFLFNSVWRFLFYLLLASVSWSYQDLFGKIVAGCLCGCAVFNTFVLCRYPSYRKIRERIAEEEDKRIEARISKEVKRQAIQQVTSPTS